MKIALETLNKIAVRLQQNEPITDMEKDMLLGLLNSVYSYYKQTEDISMLDVLIVLYERLTGVKTDKKEEMERFIEKFTAKGLVKLLDSLEQKGKRQKENKVNDMFINETRMYYKVVANKIKERGIK
ncbi:DNA polymerase subunit [Lactococcus phage CW09]|uniref:DNA polymerase subunit n=2 Tax=Ceduovirus cv20R03M TaxID=2845156 RepID=A0A482N8J3_9CAUD|nr:DNA polymerase [Lactococcus phage 20R03M]QBQ81999.1 DNA polymerase subunit [Lactococcus phage 20R03M]QBQ82032.1 DNA polymerase subunit [Lactococcus phage CW09]